jgi:hypothetical protein
MKQGIILLSILLIIIFLPTCYYDSEEYLFPQVNNQCDTTSYTFSADVKPILENNCYSCHSNNTSSFGGGIKLEDHADVAAQGSNGSLMGSITHSNGFSPMPQGEAKLEDCKITIIRKWIEAGMLNN